MRYDIEVSGFPSSHAGHLCLLEDLVVLSWPESPMSLRHGLLFLGRELAEALHQFGNLASLAKVLGFGVFKCGSIRGGEKVSLRDGNDLFEGVHPTDFPMLEM